MSATHRELTDFEDLYRQHYQQLFSFGYRMCAHKEMTKDALQEVFLIMWERKSRISEIDNLPAYLRQVTRRQVIKKINDSRKFAQLAEGQISLDGQEKSYEDLLIGLEDSHTRQAQLAAALDDLSITEREMLNLKYYRSMSYDEIAEQTGKSKQTIYNQVFKAIGKLRKFLSPE